MGQNAKNDKNPVIAKGFYLHEDVVALSRKLIGKHLYTRIGDKVTGGAIVETEAYRAPGDKASHAYNYRRTKRNEMMYSEGGVCYIYLCYGIHHLFNIVTNVEGIPHAILIRAIEPLEGIDTMLLRRNKQRVDHTLTGGPGALSQALGITTRYNGSPLSGPDIWLEDRGSTYPKRSISAGPRVGVGYAEEDALLPWRFRAKESNWTSRAK